MVTIAVALMTIVAYWTVSTALTRNADVQMRDKGTSLLQEVIDPGFMADPSAGIAAFKAYNPDIKVQLYVPGSQDPVGDAIQLYQEIDVIQGLQQLSTRNAGDQRVLAMRNDAGAAIVLAQDMTNTYDIIRSLGIVLLVISLAGVLMAIATGMVVASTGLRPIARLQQAVNYVARTDELCPMAVVGNDEIAQLTRSFNDMLAALQDSRTKQAELVADAGHELKTPLTSLRTNVELLMMVANSDSMMMSKEDIADIQRDVVAQIDEMSTLIGDLVDLAREDGGGKGAAMENLDFVDVMYTSLERVQRRRPDVEFHFEPVPWEMRGDPFGLGRATLNILDNAGKWSPKDGVVRIKMRYLDDGLMELTVADSGPGIPVEDRERIFERFFRSPEARAMPGSGLGLSIVQKVIMRHGGTIMAGESNDGGALMTVILPGHSPLDGPSRGGGDEKLPANSQAKSDFFAQLWRNQKKA
ncbi:MAG: HAMP domain-containing sensor histidine kinase [Corynebacterium sp.]|nr:HAMP domain-containing sensor histidine kinase [Corynebacterium sp.]